MEVRCDDVKDEGRSTLCSITSFLQTLSKYPSHIFLKRSLISCSTSSSSSFMRDGNSASLFSSPVIADDNVPGSEEVGICLVEGGVRPRNGREYDFKNVDRSGREDKVGSFES